MKIFIQSLQGEGTSMNVNEHTTVSDIKKHVERELCILVNRQTLVLSGRTLSDEQTIGNYPRIKDGTKIHLIVKKQQTFEDVLGNFLLTYYTQSDAERIVDEFMKEFHTTVRELSLDDLERIAISYLKEDKVAR